MKARIIYCICLLLEKQMKDEQFDLSDKFSFSSAAIMDGVGGLDSFLVCILLMKQVLLR